MKKVVEIQTDINIYLSVCVCICGSNQYKSWSETKEVECRRILVGNNINNKIKRRKL